MSRKEGKSATYEIILAKQSHLKCMKLRQSRNATLTITELFKLRVNLDVYNDGVEIDELAKHDDISNLQIITTSMARGTEVFIETQKGNR